MKKKLILIILGLIFIGCSKEQIDPNLPTIDFDFSWPQNPICFDKRSPEIKIKKVPADTTSLIMTLHDRSNRCDHGGGSVDFTGNELIPAGTIKGNYEGPCPLGWGVSPDFELTVKAVDKSGQIVGIGKKTKKYPGGK